MPLVNNDICWTSPGVKENVWRSQMPRPHQETRASRLCPGVIRIPVGLIFNATGRHLLDIL